MERLEKLKEELIKEFEKRSKVLSDAFRCRLESFKDEVMRDIDSRIEVIKQLPVNPMDYDYVELIEVERQYTTDTLRLKHPIPEGKWKFIVLGVRKGESKTG